MKKLIVLACLAAAVSMTAGTAMADSIRGKLGATGRIGFLNSADNDADETDIGFVIGGGLIYGIDDHFAAEVDITRSTFDSDIGDFGITNISLGGQYRFALQQSQLVPYVGVGLDILINDLDNGPDVDTTVGAHLSGGVDYFIQKNIALTAEAKLVAASEADINDRQSDFDPSSFSSTVGVRYFFK